MKNFYLTVGNKYRLEPHILGLHPDGWARIIAEDYDQAFKCAMKLCNNHWSSLYKDTEFKSEYFPRGEIRVFDATEVLSW